MIFAGAEGIRPNGANAAAHIGRTSRPPPRRCTVTGIEISPFGPGEGRRSRLSRITTRRDPRAFFRLSTTRPLVGRNVHTLSGSDRISTTTTARTPYTLDCGLDARRPRFDPPARSDVLPGGGRRVVGADADPCRRPRPEVPARRPPRAPSARPPPLSGVGVTLRIPPPRPRAARRYGLGRLLPPPVRVTVSIVLHKKIS